MGNALICYPDRTLEVATTFSLGSWNTDYPLTNLQNALLSKVAQSASAASANTQFLATYSAAQAVRVVALLNHNISLAGTIQVRGYSDAGLTALVYDTGAQYAWPQTFTATMVSEYPNNWILPLSTVQTARYWKVNIVDTGNAAGSIQFGRFWLGPAPLEPTIGIPEGAELGYESRTTVTESMGGTPWYNRAALPRRSFVGTLPRLTPEEKRTGLIMQKTLDTSGEMLFIRNKLDTPTDMLLHSFPGVARKVSPLRLAYQSMSEMPIEFIENVA